ncbi:MAG: hypothetical protein ACMUEL_05150 [Flavobacteriales bacterium Tduv]
MIVDIHMTVITLYQGTFYLCRRRIGRKRGKQISQRKERVKNRLNQE